MSRFLAMLGAVIFTGLALGLMGGEGSSESHILGMAPVCTESENPCWLAVGSSISSTGVLVVGIGGIGIVALTLYGAGVLFATGQLTVGLIAIGQLGVGLIGWIGQVGAGTTGIGQLVFGGLVRGQVPIGGKGAAFHAMLFRQLKSALGPFGTPYDVKQ